MEEQFFLTEVVKINENIFKEFREKGISNPYEFILEKIIEIKGVSKEEAEQILKDILTGISKYRELDEKPEEINKFLEKLPENERRNIEININEIIETKINKEE